MRRIEAYIEASELIIRKYGGMLVIDKLTNITNNRFKHDSLSRLSARRFKRVNTSEDRIIVVCEEVGPLSKPQDGEFVIGATD